MSRWMGLTGKTDPFTYGSDYKPPFAYGSDYKPPNIGKPPMEHIEKPITKPPFAYGSDYKPPPSGKPPMFEHIEKPVQAASGGAVGPELIDALRSEGTKIGQSAPQIAIDPATGRLTLDGQALDRYDQRLWGRVGRNVLDVNTASGGAYGPEAYDPRYYEPYTAYDGDNGEVTRYRLRPEYADRIGNRTQLGQSGIGGYGEVNDPSGLTWDDEFGILADRGNINAPDDSGIQGIMANYIIPAATIAAMGYGAGSMAGLWGSPAGAGAGSSTANMGSMLEGYGGVGAGPMAEMGGASAGLGSGAGAGPMAEMGGASAGLGSGAGPMAEMGGASAASTPRSISDFIRGLLPGSGGGMGGMSGMDWMSLLGRGYDFLSNRENAEDLRYANQQDREWSERMLREQTQANRPTQTNPWGTMQWSRDPQTGEWTQNVSLNPRDQGRLDMWRDIADTRMQHAGQALDPSMRINWAAISPELGRIAAAIPSFGGNQVGGGK